MDAYPKYGQVKSLDTMKPYLLKIGKRWIVIRGLKDIERVLKMRDKIERRKR
jgi:cytoplasmic iron level regulating protein YaaA (DUF328/UPF0246 family)